MCRAMVLACARPGRPVAIHDRVDEEREFLGSLGTGCQRMRSWTLSSSAWPVRVTIWTLGRGGMFAFLSRRN